MIWGNTERVERLVAGRVNDMAQRYKNNLRNHTFMENILEERP